MDQCKEKVHMRWCHWLATSATFTTKVIELPAVQVEQKWSL